MVVIVVFRQKRMASLYIIPGRKLGQLNLNNQVRDIPFKQKYFELFSYEPTVN